MIPKYIEIASKLRNMIKKGLIPVHTPLPERKLAEDFKTGRSTITAALKILKDEGYVESTQRSGTRVSAKNLNEVSVWDKFVSRGTNVAVTNEYISTSRYLTHSEKIGLTFGLHEEFAPYDPLHKAFLSLAKKADYHNSLNTFDAKGLLVLRETLSKHLLNYGINASPDNIVVFHGYLEAVYTIASSLLNRGANLYCMQGDMIWGTKTVQSTGVNMHEIPVDAEGPLATTLENSIKPGNNMLYINPVASFPSGITFSNRRMDELLKVCMRHDIVVLENDFLHDFWIKEPPAPMKARNSDNVIYIGAMVNSYVTGMRLGWAVLPDAILERVCGVKMQMNSANSSGPEIVVNEILSQGYYYEFLERLRKKLPARVSKVNQLAEKYLKGIAEWNPDNMIYTGMFKFDPRIDIIQIIYENPYFLMPHADHSAVVTNLLGMTLEDLEGLMYHCAMSAKKQLGQ